MTFLRARLQFWWRRVTQQKQLLSILALFWIARYLWIVRRIRLHIGKGHKSLQSHAAARARVESITKRCPSLSCIYWPPFFAPDWYLQLAIQGIKELAAKVSRRPYKREVLTLRDSEKIALDWIQPELIKPPKIHADGKSQLPVCVLLHGAFMDSSSATMIDLTRDLASFGFPVVVMNRRGYGGMSVTEESPGLAMFGLDEDLDEVLAHIGLQEPGRPVAIIGFSCGSGYAGRYPGKRPLLSAWYSDPKKPSDTQVQNALPGILCSVCYDPGYDVSPEGALSRIRQPIRFFVGLMIKYTYVFRHRKTLRRKSSSFQQLVGDLLSPNRGAVDTYRLTRRLSGVGGSSEWLQMQQPRIHEIEVPCLAINSRDDPVCVWSNVEDHLDQILANPNIVLAELAQGAHGCKLGFWGCSNRVHPMIAEFVTACWEEWLQQRQ